MSSLGCWLPVVQDALFLWGGMSKLCMEELFADSTIDFVSNRLFLSRILLDQTTE